MAKFIKVSKQTDNKYLNLFCAEYKGKKGKFNYFIASRKEIGNLYIQNRKMKPDAVRFIPYFKDRNNEINVILIKELRYTINDYIYATPAGLIDDNENPIISVERELFEETGAKAINITKTDEPSFSLAGLTDEITISYEVECIPSNQNYVHGEEEITTIIVKLNDLLEFIENHNVGLLSKFQLKAFYYKHKYLELKNIIDTKE